MTTTIPRTIRTRTMGDSANSDLSGSDGPCSIVPHVVSLQVAEAEIPGWVYRRFGSPDAAGQAAAVPVGHAERRGTGVRTPQARPLEPAVSDLVHVALLATGYPLQQIRCWSDDDTLILSGYVTRYFYVQVALETALRLANGRRIEAHIEILPSPDRDQWDD